MFTITNEMIKQCVSERVEVRSKMCTQGLHVDDDLLYLIESAKRDLVYRDAYPKYPVYYVVRSYTQCTYDENGEWYDYCDDVCLIVSHGKLLEECPPGEYVKMVYSWHNVEKMRNYNCKDMLEPENQCLQFAHDYYAMIDVLDLSVPDKARTFSEYLKLTGLNDYHIFLKLSEPV